MKNNVSINRILYDLCPEVLTDKDLRTAEAHRELEELYADKLDTPIDEDEVDKQNLNQIADRIYNVLNPEDVVCSTVDAPILDETNLLFKCEGIDDTLLFKTLELRRAVTGHTRRELSDLQDDVLFNMNKSQYKERIVTTESGGRTIKERWSQRGNKQFNVLDEVLFDGDIDTESESLQDINEDYHKHELYRKEKKVLETSKFRLNEARSSYRKRQTLRDSSIGYDWIRYNNNMMECFSDIRRYQAYIEKIEKVNYDSYRREVISSRERKYDYYLGKFTDYQQEELKNDREPKREREDVLAKYSYLKHRPVKPKFVPSWKQDSNLRQIA